VRISALVIFVGAIASACGSDSSTGPGSLDSGAALQSLAIGMQGVSLLLSPTTPHPNASFGGIAPLLDRVTVSIDGASQNMFALGLRETFPAGTCEETLFIDPALPPTPGTCTPPALGLAVILWQAHSATQRPDRMVFMVADAGTSNFDLASAPMGATPAIALYAEGDNNLWSSLSGTLNSQVAATSQTCDLPLPPYAKSGACNVATFDEQGSIVFETLSQSAPSTKQVNLVLPRQTLHGLWVAISEVQPVPVTATRFIPAWLQAARVSPVR
jgi:hypothetical protein